MTNFELLQLYKSQNNKEARNELVLKNQNLVYYVYNHFFSGYNLDESSKNDMISSGLIGLMEAIDAFDISRYNVLSTYAVPYIRDRMSRVLSPEICFSRYENEMSEATMEEQIPDTYQEDTDRYSVYQFLSKICTDEELDVTGIINRTCDEPYWSVNEIAKELNMSSERVRFLYKSAIEKLNQPWIQWYLYKIKGVYSND